MSQFTEDEIFKLKQLICTHKNLRDDGIRCSCCGDYDKKCKQCDKIEDHTCNDHNTEDGYCNSCR